MRSRHQAPAREVLKGDAHIMPAHGKVTLIAEALAREACVERVSLISRRLGVMAPVWGAMCGFPLCPR